MLSKNDLLVNQRLINEAIAEFKTVFKAEESPSSFLYNSKHLVIQNKCGNALGKNELPIRTYLEILEFLTTELSKINSRDLDLAQQMRMDLIRFIYNILSKALDTIKNESVEEQILNELQHGQMQIEQSIKQHFNEQFILPRPLDLTKIREEYEHSYTHYGQGVFGFFKLPVKLYFRQQSRTEELVFLERVESHCQNSTSLNEDEKNSMRYSAATLVLNSICSERFGEGSQLAKILKARIASAKLTNQSHQMSGNFVEECAKRYISIPDHIKPPVDGSPAPGA